LAADELIFGLHSVEAALRRPQRALVLWLAAGRDDARLQNLAQMADACDLPVERLDRQELDRRAGHGRHQGAILKVRPAEAHSESFLEQLLTDLDEPPFLLVLDGVTDPHNLGACLRSADAAGVHAVIAPRDRACGLTPVVRKVASGAAESVPLVQVTNLSRSLSLLRESGVFLFGAVGEGEQTIYQADLRGALGLVMGAEGRCLRRLTRERCDALLRIPMRGSVASLNVSVAAGIFLFEALRQRQV